MPESQDNEVHVGSSADMTAEQLAASTHGHSISKAVVEQAHKFLQAIGLYMKTSMERQQAQTNLRQTETYLRANPGQRANKTKMAQYADYKTKYANADQQEASVKSAVGIKMVQVVGSVVNVELERATADAVRRTEEKCKAEFQIQLDTMRLAYEAQLAAIQQSAIEAARAEVAKGIEGFERSRAAAASLMVAETPANAPSEHFGVTNNRAQEEISSLRSAHNKLAEAFAGFAENTRSQPVHVKTEDASGSNTQSAQNADPAQSADALDGGISTEMIVEAVHNLNERMEAIESRQTSAETINNANATGATRNSSAGQSSSQTRQEPGQISDGFAEYLRLRTVESLAKLSPLEADFIILADVIQKMGNKLEWVTSLLSETWALTQLSHVVWGSERMTVREFARTMLATDDDGPSASGADNQSWLDGAAANGHQNRG
ncbi:hypothetical protein A4X13_0g2264 [Tilletia indica]|uniref:Uncharacterized protein n=1 Tax=Tilletia indica TaxID=43049 RepID=A0A177TWP2_9BASI|nr:hypothetical protein A4X13_0g2264 [Tilletia indica]